MARLPFAMDCPFCRPEASRLIAQDDLTLVLRDGYPISPGHCLIVPRRHVASFFDIGDDEQVSMLALVRKVKALLDAEFKPAGYNVGLNDGSAAGQTVMHVHMHLIPRYPGDRPDPRGGVRWIIPEKADYWSTGSK